MRFRIWSLLYVFALLAAALATFGALGILATLVVMGFWTIVHWPDDIQKGAAYGAVATLLFLCSCGLLLPAVASARGAAQQVNCRGQMMQVALALLNYHDVYKSFPPAFVADKDGKPMHSWRVLVLPFMECDDIYKAYKFDEPWDGPNNRRLASKIPSVYQCPGHIARYGSGRHETQYLAVVGPETVWPGTSSTKLSDVKDKHAHTILFLEVHGQGVHWMEPRDVTMQEAIELLGPSAARSSTGHYHESVFYRHYDPRRCIAYVDRHVGELAYRIEAQSIRTLCTKSADDLLVGFQGIDPPESPSEIRWEGVFSFAVFSVLAILPFPWWAIRERVVARASRMLNHGSLR
jgi:hypothetical protein